MRDDSKTVSDKATRDGTPTFHGEQIDEAGAAAFSRYAALLGPSDLSLLSAAYAIVVADMAREKRIVDTEEVTKLVLIEGMGRRSSASEVARAAIKRMSEDAHPRI